MKCACCGSDRVFQVPETAFRSFCAECDCEFDIRTTADEKRLAEALYALNRVIPSSDTIEEIPAVERMGMNKLIVARDYIWAQLQTINPTEWKD